MEPVIANVGLGAAAVTALTAGYSHFFFRPKVRDSFRESLSALAKAVESKDDTSIGHAERVAHVSCELARALGASRSETEKVEYGALLHDIGKAGVPRHCLIKAGPLDDGEWQLVHRHPSLGAEMVEDSLNDHEYFPNLGPIIRAHHERYDGSGYPAGMRGEQIPKEARIISASAAWCAMLSRRPWRAAMSHATVAAYMRANAGKEFDPELVELLVKLT